jgi:predicted metal-dependent RNase
MSVINLVSLQIRVTRLGLHSGPHHAVDSIEPSCCVIDIIEKRTRKIVWRMVIDCGVCQVHGEFRVEQLVRPDLSYFTDGKQIDAIYYTHGHVDHYGGSPFIVQYFAPHIRAYGSAATLKMLLAAYRYEETHIKKHFWPLKQYGLPEVRALIRLLEKSLEEGDAITREGAHDHDGIPVWVMGAGHTDGAVSFIFELGSVHVLITGDMCAHAQLTLEGRGSLPASWLQNLYILGCDMTYAATPDDGTDYQSNFKGLMELCHRKTLVEGGRVAIPTFSWSRSTNIVEGLLRDEELARRIPIYLDGMAISHSRMFIRGEHAWCEELSRPVHLGGVRLVEGKNARRLIARSKEPCISVFTPGMGGPCIAGSAGDEWRKETIQDPTATLVNTGYAAPGTDWAKILAAHEERKRTGKNPVIEFRVQVRTTGDWSSQFLRLNCDVVRARIGGHDNRTTTMNWLMRNPARVIMLSHGSVASLAAGERYLREHNYPGQVLRADKVSTILLDI